MEKKRTKKQEKREKQHQKIVAYYQRISGEYDAQDPMWTDMENKLGFSRVWLQKVLRRYNVDYKREIKRRTPEDQEALKEKREKQYQKIVAYYQRISGEYDAQGPMWTDMEDKFGFSRVWLQKVLKRYNVDYKREIKRRTPEEKEALEAEKKEEFTQRAKRIKENVRKILG